MPAQKDYENIIRELHLQKDYLGMTYAVLAKKSGVSEPTVKRILSGRHASAHFEHVLAIAEVLGVDLSAKARNTEAMKRAQAERKAKMIVDLVRGNSALEGQALTKAAYRRMIDKTVNELLSGPKHALWAE